MRGQGEKKCVRRKDQGYRARPIPVLAREDIEALPDTGEALV
jgi:hypothetical protein